MNNIISLEKAASFDAGTWFVGDALASGKARVIDRRTVWVESGSSIFGHCPGFNEIRIDVELIEPMEWGHMEVQPGIARDLIARFVPGA